MNQTQILPFPPEFKPDASFDLDIAGNTLAYTHGDPGSCAFDGGAPIDRLSPSSQWMHIAIVTTSGGQGDFYVDGQKQAFTSGDFPAGGGGDIATANFSGLIDEVRFYDQMLEERKSKNLPAVPFLICPGTNCTSFLSPMIRRFCRSTRPLRRYRDE